MPMRLSDARFRASETVISYERSRESTYNADRVNATTHDACSCHAINNAHPRRSDRTDDQSGVGVERRGGHGREGEKNETRDDDSAPERKRERGRRKEQSRTLYVTTALRRRILLRILRFLNTYGAVDAKRCARCRLYRRCINSTFTRIALSLSSRPIRNAFISGRLSYAAGIREIIPRTWTTSARPFFF